MKIIRKIEDLRKELKEERRHSIGFVPTMGDLHEGHCSLIRRSKKENKITVLSIFVNPSQFDRKEDYDRYKRTEKTDLKKAKETGVDFVFIPTAGEMYPAHYQSWVSVEEVSKNLCGKFRRGHFRGVATIVLKLLNIVKPDRLYLGMKDFQQYKVVEQMARDFNLEIEIVPCPTVREKDGLAMSSRNGRLSSLERERAASISVALHSTAHLIKSKLRYSPSFYKKSFKQSLALSSKDKVEYFAIVHPGSLEPLKKISFPLLLAAAVWVGNTRLIDNLCIKEGSSWPL